MKALWTTVVALMLPAVTLAQSPSFVGDEFQLDSDVTFFSIRTQMSSDSGGNFVAVWDDNALRIGARRYQADGAPIGSEFQVNTDNVTYKSYANIDHGPNGDFVVVWDSGRFGSPNTQDGSLASVHGQRYQADGAAIGSEFQINTYTTNSQRLAGVAVGPDGRFVVVWTSNGSFGPDTDYSIQGQLYASDGGALGGEFQVNSYITGNTVFPSADFTPNGEFVVVWQNNNSSIGDDDGFSIQGRRFSGDAAQSEPISR